jgi:REP element-mobilizing transposase RayT
MSRPLRIEYPGAMYHVMNRGNQRQDVFRKKVDCVTFLEKLEYFSDLFNIDVYCYVLMNNHFHLLVRTNDANLGRFMQSFLTSFTMILNRRNQKNGHLFQGRYKAQLVETQEYISKLSRYIHLNPIRIKKYKNITIEEKRNILLNYTWSSFAAHIGLNEPEHFLKIKTVLSTWGSNNMIRMKKYREYVEEGLYKDIDNPFELAIRQQIIGSETFAERLTRTKILKRKVKDKREERMRCIFQSSIDPDVIINAVAAHFGTDAGKITQRKSTEKLPRRIALYLCTLYCNRQNNRLRRAPGIFD